MDVPQSSSGRIRLPACAIALLLGLASSAFAQTRLRANSAASFLKEPGGLRLGSLVNGVTYLTGRSNGGHLETTIEGWLAASATSATTRDGFDLTVIDGGGASIRATPGGAIIARVQEGTLLAKAGTRGDWVRVRRLGWVPRGSFDRPDAVVAVAPPPAATPPRNTPPPPPPPPPAPVPVTAGRPAPSDRASNDTTARKDASTGEMVSSRGTLRKGATLSAVPDGAAIGSLGEAEVRVIDRQRDWVKISVDGWVRSSDLAAEVDAAPSITGAMVRQQPDKYVGQTVTWRLQYLSVQLADDLRPEMPRGHPYVLARGPLPEPGFVYLMVSKEQADEFRARSPLDELAIDAVIKAGRTRYLPTPVLEFRGWAAR